MLRAIGYQIKETENREASRDLNGHRLRDIHEAKRIDEMLVRSKLVGHSKASGEQFKLKRKIEKLLADPTYVFDDMEYEKSRQDLTQNMSASYDEGIRMTNSAETNVIVEDAGCIGLKRKATSVISNSKAIKKMKKFNRKELFLGDDEMTSSSETDSSEV